MLQIPQGMFPVSMTKPVTTAGGFSTDVVSLKNAVMAWIVVHLNQTTAAATTIVPMRTLAVGSAGVVLANVVPIWYGLVTTSTNAIGRVAADAADYTVGGSIATGNIYVIFQIDPANLGGAYDCIYVDVATGDAANFADITCWVQPKYASKTADQLSFIVD